MSGENQQHHAPATPLPNFQGGQCNPLSADIETIIQERLHQERKSWEVKRAAQDHPLSSHAGNLSHQGHSHYTDNGDSYRDTEEKNPTFVTPIPHQRVNVQAPLVHNDPIGVAMKKQLDNFKKFMEIAFPASIAPVAPTTKMPFSDRLDAFWLPPGFKLPQLELLTGSARDWYMKLPLKTIDTYQQTADAFVAKFGTTIQKRQDERILMEIQQGENESLRAYHSRCNNLLLNILMVDDKVAYMVFFKDLRYSKMKKALLIRTPLT
ncbi:hypothetical protein LIER_22752 [Lithospermum erythrorhizon]|uniref:Retrotransposon gag domain-containing protein n=1 Tax=Lithospermum erythrorhizon TaxID=34254 RepID=A0AAV3QW90_LITER